MANILEELHQVFNTVFSHEISIIDFMKFVFNDTGTPNDYNVFPLEYRNFYRYYKSDSFMSQTIQTDLLSISHRNFDIFLQDYNNPDILNVLKDSLKKKCQQYSLPSDYELDVLFNELIKFYIENEMNKKAQATSPKVFKKHPAPLFKIKKPRHCASFCPHPAEQDIMAHLQQYRILFLYSLSGTGKTELIKEICLNYLKYCFKDVFMLSYEQNLTASLNKIEYAKQTSNESEVLAKKKTDSLLIINKMNIESVLDNFKTLSKLNLTILVTVDSLSLPEGIPGYKLPPLPFESLKSIFKSAYKKDFTDETAMHLIQGLNNHTLSIRLLGKALAKDNKNIEDLLTTFVTTPLKDLSLAEIKHNGTRTHIHRVLSDLITYTDFINERSIPSLQMLSVFNGCNIDLLLLKKILPDISDECLSTLIENEILLYTDEEKSTVQMHRILSEVIQSKIKFKNMFAETTSPNESSTPRFLPLMQHLQEAISELRNSDYSAVQLQDLSFSFFKVMNQHHIRFNTNKSQTHYSKEGNYWLAYCFDCIHFYNEYGNMIYAECVLDSLLDSYAKIPMPPALMFEKRFSKFHHKWQTETLDKTGICTLYDDIINFMLNTSSNSTLFTPPTAEDMLTVKAAIYQNFTLYLEQIVLYVKTNEYTSKTVTLLEKALQQLNSLIAVMFGNSDSFAFFQHYMNTWRFTPEQAIQQIDLLLELEMDKITRLQLLSDLIYFEAQLFLSAPNQSYISVMTIHYKEMNTLFSTCRNIPSLVNESCYIATLYYALCRSPINSSFLRETLDSAPDYYKKMIRSKNPQIYNDFVATVEEYCL